MLVVVCFATTRAPGTTAPCGSSTRPLTLAELMVSCANAGEESRSTHTNANTQRMTTPLENPHPQTKWNVRSAGLQACLTGPPKGGHYAWRRLRARRRAVGRSDDAVESGELVIW